jgi:hypothetical protein
MGMNLKVGLFSESWMFYVVIALIILIAPITIGTANATTGSSGRGQKGRQEPFLRRPCPP